MKKKNQSSFESSSLLPSFLKTFIGFVLGTISAPFLLQFFVGFLPGPKITAKVSEALITSGNATGCRLYSLQISADEPLEYIYGEVTFPSNVDSSLVGVPIKSFSSTGKRLYVQSCEIGKNREGRFTIIQSAVATSVDMRSSQSSRTFTLSASKIPRYKPILGFIVTPNLESSSERSDIQSEGYYEYIKLGLVVRKNLVVQNYGVDHSTFNVIQESNRTFTFDSNHSGHIGMTVGK